MAAFSNEDQAEISDKFVEDLRKRDGITDIPFSRPKVWAASQAIRDILDSATFRTTVSDAIDTALSPETMTSAQKKRLYGRVSQKLFPGEVA